MNATPNPLDQLRDLASTIRTTQNTKQQAVTNLHAANETHTQAQANLTHNKEALEILTYLQDTVRNQGLQHVTTTMNKVIAAAYPHQPLTVSFEQTLHGGKNPHLNLILTDPQGHARQLAIQEGHGLQQVISLIFTLCVLEMTKVRPLLILDEVMNALNQDTLAIMDTILHAFANTGMQIIVIEHAYQGGYIIEATHDGNQTSLQERGYMEN